MFVRNSPLSSPSRAPFSKMDAGKAAGRGVAAPARPTKSVTWVDERVRAGRGHDVGMAFPRPFVGQAVRQGLEKGSAWMHRRLAARARVGPWLLLRELCNVHVHVHVHVSVCTLFADGV